MASARILLVEDERIVALHLRQQLAKMGYTVAAIAASGAEALRQIEAQRPEIVLMDIHIEGPIDGIETTARIAPELQVPVIYLTAYAEETTLERASATKPYGYLLKPFSERELHATIQMALAHHAVDVVSRDNERNLNELVNARTAELEEQISRRMKTEQALRQAQKLEAIGQLTGGVAHEFNNLLTIVVGCLSLLERRTDDASRAKLIGAALDAASRGANLTRQLLSFGRRQMVQPERLDANTVLIECDTLVRTTVGPLIQVNYQLQPINAVCLVDREELVRVFLNLATNARQAMSGGGTLSIETSTMQVGPPDADENLGDGKYVRIVLRDTGHGMTPDVLARAFEPFFTTRDVGAGSGLGLSQAYGFVKQAGGHATLESVVGEGTHITLFLPFAAAAPEAAAVADTALVNNDRTLGSLQDLRKLAC
jgi:signal transduction histidine kinase